MCYFKAKTLMVFSMPDTSEIKSVVKKITDVAGFPAGLIYGGTAQIALPTGSANLVTDLEQRISVLINEVTGAQISIGGNTNFPGRTLKILGPIDSKHMPAVLGLILLHFYKEFGLPGAALAEDLLHNFLVGYAIGGLFDPVATTAGYPVQFSSSAMATPSYSTTANTGVANFSYAY